MKAIRISAIGEELTTADVDTPTPGAGEVLVAVKAAGICHSDAHYRSGVGSLPQLPITPGHEVAGIIESVGPGVSLERTAINTPIQGTAADIIKLAMIKVEQELQKEKLQTKMLLQIHDELVFEVPEDEVDKTKKLVKDSMESVLELDVPLVVNISVGKNLAKV